MSKRYFYVGKSVEDYLSKLRYDFDDFIKANTNSLQFLQNYFEDYSTIYQYVFVSIFPKCYFYGRNFGVINKTTFMLCDKEWSGSKKYLQLQLKKNLLKIYLDLQNIRKIIKKLLRLINLNKDLLLKIFLQYWKNN